MAENAGLHAQLLAQAREAGVLDERERMAREIHDTIAQGLTGIVTQLEAAEQAARPARPTGTGTSTTPSGWPARASPRRAGRSRRRGPRRSTARLLEEALADVAQRWSDAERRAASTSPPPATPMPLHPEIEVALLRTAQEALANVAKHAAASPGRLDAVVHGRRGDPRRPRRRRRVRGPGRRGAGSRTAGSG